MEEEKCPYCESNRMIKRGLRRNQYTLKQRYSCKDCEKRFVIDQFKRFKGDGKIITLVMDLYFKGLSLRQIKDHLHQFHDMNISHVTIYRWVTRFMEILNYYLSGFKPKVGDIWHFDEQMVKSKGKWKWCWNAIDSDTKFLIASHVTEGRSKNDARLIMRKAKILGRRKPRLVVTDGLGSYTKAFKKEFWNHHRTIDHWQLKDFEDKHNNNLIERYHGTFKSRSKVMRGFCGKEQVMVDGFRSYYNFLRPHMGLNGLTPAQMAGIHLGLNGGNRWLQLLKTAKAEEVRL